jgi:DNA polymerase I-like protein with 3'-5' exonuclease and polymerase domains
VETDGRGQTFFESRAEALEYRQRFEGRCKLREVAGTEGQDIINRFHAGAPFLKELIKKVSDKIESTGVLKILGGRHLHFPMKPDGSFDWSFKGLNRLVQGTSGYHLRKALVAVDRQVPEFFLQLTIHDELCGSISDLRVAKDVSEVMRTCVSARVPFRVECEVGRSMGQTKVLCNVGKCLNLAIEEDKFFGCHEHAEKKVS